MNFTLVLFIKDAGLLYLFVYLYLVIPSNVVTMNSIARMNFINSKKNVKFQIVYSNKTNFKDNKISIFSPIATALIGYKVGDETEWIIPAGIIWLRIDEIIYQSETAGHDNL